MAKSTNAPVDPKNAKAPKAPKLDKDGKPKVTKVKAKKPVHPLVGNKDKEVYPFKSVPADYAFGKMAPLKKDDFSGLAPLIEYKASVKEWEAKELRAKAETLRKTGDNKTAKKLVKVQGTLQKLREELLKQGLDPDEILASAMAETTTDGDATE